MVAFVTRDIYWAQVPHSFMGTFYFAFQIKGRIVNPRPTKGFW